ncbi:RUN and FYVE domain-containing protein 1 [Phytophthora cinnamomi]|uniref:RUN and FYVE domain-containing protein 1 n=1 Tax=Phytophthora cinnamomi TaxID=4785 RepID=UPI00355A5D3F|nr:RUN and FYVE domain-containing protein 1 [Phytophthora cinnamomi]
MNHGYAHSHAGFPLRSDFFRSLPLAKFKNDKLYRLAKANALACLNQSFNDQWRYVPPEKDGTQIRKDTSNMAVSYRLVRAATCFGKYYIDTLILHNVIKPNDVSTSSTSTDSSSDAKLQERAVRSNSQPEGSGSGEYAEIDLDKDENEGRRGSVWEKVTSHSTDSYQRRNSEANSEDTPSGKLPSECSSANTEERLKEEAAAAADGLGQQAEEMLTVKWAAFETGISGKQDICLVDYLSLAYIPNSEPRQRVHVWCFTSADGDRVGCMELKDTHHVTRTTLTKLGVFWRKVSEDETEVIVCGSFPSKHASMVSAILLGCLNRLQGIVEDLRMSSQLYIQRATWVKNNERTTCNLCTRNFHALRRKHHCRRCGEVVCSDCSTVETIDLPAIGYSKLRLCKVCSIRARTTPLKQVAKTNVFDHLVRARSLSNVGSSGATSSFTRSSYTDNNQMNHHEDSYSHSATSDMAPSFTVPGSCDGRSNSTYTANCSTDNSNHDVQLPSHDSFHDYTISTHNPETGDAPTDINDVTAVVHPMTACLGSPTEEYDDFINERCLKSQLCAMEQKKRSIGSNSNMFDLLCELACQTLNCPVASVSIVDDNDNFIRSAVGLEGNSTLDGELSVFIEKIMGSTPTIVLDASVDKQALKFFSLRSLPAIRFFAGCPIYSRTGKKLGYVCVADFSKRDTLGASCAFTMERLATLAVTTMERNITIKNNNASNTNTTVEEADFTKRIPPPNPMHPAMLFDRPNGNNSTARSNNNSNKDPSAHSEALVGRVYEIVEDEMPPVTTPSTVNLNPSANATRSGTGERSAGYYEAQERMRKLLLKSYHTQQTLATGGSQ